MPQGPIAVASANLAPQGAKSTKNISVQTTVKATPGTVLTVAVITPGSGTGTINDVAASGTPSAANQVYTIPESVGAGAYPVNMVCNTAITVVPGSGQVLAVTWV